MNEISKIDSLNELAFGYASGIGFTVKSVTPIAGAGSSRHYYRYGFKSGDCGNIAGSSTVGAVGTIGTSEKENRSFIDLSSVFRRYKLPVPEIFAVSPDFLEYLQEDLGDDSLFDVFRQPEQDDVKRTYIVKCMELLPEFQTVPEVDWREIVFNPPFSGREVLNDLHYFKDCFLRPLGIVFDEFALEREFDNLASYIDNIGRSELGLMLRDFQSRNVLIKYGNPYFIDFQGARKGPAVYDAVSFLWQAKAGICPEFRRIGLETFAEKFVKLRGNVSEAAVKSLLEKVPVIVLIRTLQVLGAYGFRGLVEKKPHFLKSIPRGIANLTNILDNPESEGSVYGWEHPAAEVWPEICRISEQLRSLPISEEISDSDFPYDGLKVTVYSFSYKKGYPFDLSGNGGGFMFDCRGLHNPGRYEEYRTKTGMDKEVIEFLSGYDEVRDFLEDCRRLVFRSVKRYLQRGFTSLQVGFGCTGGQHRSVYCAGQIALMLAEEFPEIEVMVCHREQKVYRRIAGRVNCQKYINKE